MAPIDANAIVARAARQAAAASAATAPVMQAASEPTVGEDPSSSTLKLDRKRVSDDDLLAYLAPLNTLAQEPTLGDQVLESTDVVEELVATPAIPPDVRPPPTPSVGSKASSSARGTSMTGRRKVKAA